MEKPSDGYTVVPFPKVRRLMVDGGRMGRQKHTIHGLVEIDVTAARAMIRDHKAQTGETLSFTAFIMTCLGHTVAKNKMMQAYRTWFGRMVIFEDVDVNTLFEVEVDGKKMILPHIIRGVNRKSFRELHEEIRTFQAGHTGSREANFVGLFASLPSMVRRWFYWFLFKNPRMLKDFYGTVILTAVGMFGRGSGWAIPVSNHTLQVTLGGIVEKPGIVEGRIEPREYLDVTFSFDHDIVDGAPAARFIQRFKDLVESGYGLGEEPE